MLVLSVRVEELRVHLQGPVQVEAPDVQHAVDLAAKVASRVKKEVPEVAPFTAALAPIFSRKHTFDLFRIFRDLQHHLH